MAEYSGPERLDDLSLAGLCSAIRLKHRPGRYTLHDVHAERLVFCQRLVLTRKRQCLVEIDSLAACTLRCLSLVNDSVSSGFRRRKPDTL